MNSAEKTIAGALAVRSPAPIVQAAPEPVLRGLELSETEYWSPERFRLNPANEPFRALKSADYMDKLEADIRENGILDDLKAMPDGLLLAGESRLEIAKRLGLKKIPVKVVLSDLGEEEQERRLILDNLLRFEIDKDTRAALLYKIGLYDKPVQEAAQELGVSTRQVIRDRAVAAEAAELAQERGEEKPTRQDFAEARERKNADRRASTPAKAPGILERLKTALESLDARGGQYAESAQYVREAVGI